MRIDKFLWSVRLAKTRSIATKNCGAEKVKLNGSFTKSSKLIQVSDEISVKVLPVWRSFKILDIPKSRVGAKLVPDLIVETTSQDDLLKIEEFNLMNKENKQLGIKGRPTKKNRRDIDSFKI